MLKLILTILIVGYTANLRGNATIDGKLVLEKTATACQLELAKHYFREQQQEKAFETFLNCLQSDLDGDHYHATLEEKELYQKALALYFETKGSRFCAGTEQLLAEYAPIVENHPEYAELAFIVAAAYANRGEFVRLFDLFYQAYHQLPSHYLALKTQAILWIKLFERTHPGKLKEERREQIIRHLTKALEKFPLDTSLYRLVILYTPDENRMQVISECLNKIIGENLIIPRGELEFYMENAQSLKDKELIKRFIDKASKWYPTSRIIGRAQLKLKSAQN